MKNQTRKGQPLNRRGTTIIKQEYEPEDFRDSRRYQVYCRLVSRIIKRDGETQYAKIAERLGEAGRSLDSIVRTLEAELKCVTITRHVTFIAPMPKEEIERRLKLRKRYEDRSPWAGNMDMAV
jgi:hypothetical protein